MKLKFDPLVPVSVAGIESIKCECGWESVFIKPEEDGVQVMIVLQHLVDCHFIKVPRFTCTSH